MSTFDPKIKNENAVHLPLSLSLTQTQWVVNILGGIKRRERGVG